MPYSKEDQESTGYVSREGEEACGGQRAVRRVLTRLPRAGPPSDLWLAVSVSRVGPRPSRGSGLCVLGLPCLAPHCDPEESSPPLVPVASRQMCGDI